MPVYGNLTPKKRHLKVDKIEPHVSTPRPTANFRTPTTYALDNEKKSSSARATVDNPITKPLKSTFRTKAVDTKSYATEAKENVTPRIKVENSENMYTPIPARSYTPNLQNSSRTPASSKSSLKPGTPVTPKLSHASLRNFSAARNLRTHTANNQKARPVPEGQSRLTPSLSAAAIIHGRKSEGGGALKPVAHSRIRTSDSIFMNNQTQCFSPSVANRSRPSGFGPDNLLRKSFSSGKHVQKCDESSSIQVAIRVRPLNPREKYETDIRNIIEVRKNEIQVNTDSSQAFTFAYDSCFNSDCADHSHYGSQKSVYEKMATPLLGHAFDGYNVCLFAYGQTGSGKSYCIMGERYGMECDFDAELPDEVGIIPRFCKDFFAKIEGLQAQNNEDQRCLITAEMTYIEIYNEKIYDLLSIQSQSIGQISDPDKKEALKIREHPINGPYVEGASTHLVTSYADVHTWLMLGNKQRSIAATAMNDKSSRSHSVFSIVLTQTWVETIDETEYSHSTTSKINLVDLAGSERIGVSCAENDKLKEGVSINKSLLTLGKVITALAENTEKRKTFIPYRDSSLTWLLKESLGGNSKTTMIATISSANIHQEETLSTLRYACQARKIVNWNHVNEDPSAIVIRALKKEVERLQATQGASELLFDTEIPAPSNEVVEEEDSRKKLQDEMEAQIRKEREEIDRLKNRLKTTQSHLIERTRDYETKLKTAEAEREEALDRCKMSGILVKIENNQPALVNLCEDPQLSQTLLYSLKDGETTLGNGKSNVELKNLHSSDVHCMIENTDGKLILYPKNGSETFVNGKMVSKQQKIFHDDRIVLDGIYYFRVKCPEHLEPNPYKKNLDFYFARDELLREQEKRFMGEIEKERKVAKLEMLRELEEHRATLKIQTQSLNTNVKHLSDELMKERKQNFENELVRMQLEEEKMFLQEQIQKMKYTPDSTVQSTSMNAIDENGFLNEMEAIFNESMQVVESDTDQVTTADVELWLLLTEANKICMKLKKPYEFKQHSQLNVHGITTAVLVYDFEHNLSASLNLRNFKECLFILQEISVGRQMDDNIFEASLKWERHEMSTKLPLVANKLKENMRRISLNSSMNSSIISTNHSLMGPPKSATMMGLRRLSNCNSFQASIREVHPTASAIIARTLQEALSKSISSFEKRNIYFHIIKNFGQMHKLVQELLKYCNQSAHNIDEEEHLSALVKLSLCSQSTCALHSNLMNEPFSDNCKEVSEFTHKFSMAGVNLSRILIRMMQGVEQDVSSLFEKEARLLLHLVADLLDDVGFLSALTENAVTDAYVVLGDKNLCLNYLFGVSRGLEWLVGKAAKDAKNGSDMISSYSKENSSREITSCRLKVKAMASAIAQFLSLFSQLKVVPSVDNRLGQKAASRETIKFISRVAFASGNTLRLTKVLLSVLGEFQRKNTGNLNLLRLKEDIQLLHESLGELVEEAGVGSSYEKADISSADQSLVSNEAFMDSLHINAVAAFKSINGFQLSLKKYADSKTFATSSFISGSSEDKRVRFDISGSGCSDVISTDSGTFNV